MADISYYESDYIDFHYYNYIADANSSMQAFDTQLVFARVIHLMEALTYRIRDETRLHKIREETRLYKIRAENKTYKIKEG